MYDETFESGKVSETGNIYILGSLYCIRSTSLDNLISTQFPRIDSSNIPLIWLVSIDGCFLGGNIFGIDSEVGPLFLVSICRLQLGE